MKLTLQEAENMMVCNDGTLDLRDSEYTELPEDLCVTGNLDLRSSQTSRLPKKPVGGRRY